MIRYLFGVGGLTLAFFVLITISMGMLTGATVAYDVEEPADATVERVGLGVLEARIETKPTGK